MFGNIDDLIDGIALYPSARWTETGQFAGHIHLDVPGTVDLERALQEDIRLELEELHGLGNEDLRVDLAVCAHLLGDTENAIKELRIAESKQDKDAQYLLGRILLEQKQLAGSTKMMWASHDTTAQKGNTAPSWTGIANHLREAIMNDPGNTPAYFYLGKAILGLVKDESYKDAQELYQLYLQAGAPIGQQEEVIDFINSQDVNLQREAAVTRGMEALRDNQAQQSIPAFEEAIRLGDQDAYFYLGKAFQRIGNLLRAADAYRTFSAMGSATGPVEKATGKHSKFQITKDLGDSVNQLYNKPALLLDTLKSITDQARGKSPDPGIWKLASDLNRHLSALQLSFLLELDLGLGASDLFFLFQIPGEPYRLRLSGNKTKLLSLKEALGAKDYRPAQDQAIASFTPDLSVEITADESCIVWDESTREKLLEIPSEEGAATYRADALKNEIAKIVHWKTILSVENPESELQELFDFELVVTDKNRMSTSYIDKEVTIPISDNNLSIRNGNGFLGINFQVTLKKKPDQEIFLYGVDLSTSRRIKFRNDEVLAIRPEDIEVGDTIPFRRAPYGWGLSAEEKKVTRWFKVFATEYEVDPLLFEQDGLAGTVVVDDVFPPDDDAMYSPISASKEWCAKTIQLTLERVS